ncbi:hypothetical protein V8C34DRAFT_285455 [Trichoderma compactum]
MLSFYSSALSWMLFTGSPVSLSCSNSSQIQTAHGVDPSALLVNKKQGNATLFSPSRDKLVFVREDNAERKRNKAIQ